MAFIISLSPIGVFTMMAWVVATQGAEILGSLALVILCAYLGYIVHAVVVYSASVAVFAKVSPLAFFKGAAAAMILRFYLHLLGLRPAGFQRVRGGPRRG